MSYVSTDNPNPLTGRRILVTRAIHQAGILSDALRALGAEPVEVPVLEISPPDSFDPLDAAIKKLNSFDWLILTSANTVKSFAARCSHLGIDLTEAQHLRVAAVGSATAEAARKSGFRVTVVPDSYISESLVAALGEEVAGKRVLLARAKIARDVIPDALSKVASQFTIVDAYQTQLPQGSKDLLIAAIATGLDAATFTSSSSARNLAEVAREAQLPYPFKGVQAISIGSVTSATLRELGWEPADEASHSDIPGLIDAVIRVLAPKLVA